MTVLKINCHIKIMFLHTVYKVYFCASCLLFYVYWHWNVMKWAKKIELTYSLLFPFRSWYNLSEFSSRDHNEWATCPRRGSTREDERRVRDHHVSGRDQRAGGGGLGAHQRGVRSAGQDDQVHRVRDRHPLEPLQGGLPLRQHQPVPAVADDQKDIPQVHFITRVF